MPGEFTVTRQAPYNVDLAVNYALSGSAVNGTDYQSLSGTVTIPAGSPTAVIDVNPLDDGDGDDTGTGEAVIAALQPAATYQVGDPSTATVTINEEPTTLVTIAATTPSASEQGPQPGVFTVTRSGPTRSALTVTYAFSGAAVPGTDFTDPGATVTIPAGQASASFNVAPIDDGDADDNLTSESVTATLIAGADYTVGAPDGDTRMIAIGMGMFRGIFLQCGRGGCKVRNRRSGAAWENGDDRLERLPLIDAHSSNPPP